MIFELTLYNYENGKLDLKKIAERVAQFTEGLIMHDDGLHFNDKPLNILLTWEPLFFDKAKKHLHNSKFVIGFDTYIRMLNLKYYQGSLKNLLDLLKQQKDIGTQFIIAGRMMFFEKGPYRGFCTYKEHNICKVILDQLDRYYTKEEEILLKDVEYMFKHIDFRHDLSSHTLRQAKL